MLRYKADLRTLAFMIVTTGLLFWQWSRDSVHPILFIWGCFMAVSVTSMAHNHEHLGMWKSPLMNKLQDYWLTLFYGYPIFAWIPTHNRNHHVHNNKPADYTATYKVGEGNSAMTLLAYPTYSGMIQQRANLEYLKELWRKDRAAWTYCMSQIVVLLAYYALVFALDWKKALFYVFIPHQVGLNMVLVFNYIQHVHADEESPINHSRNFVGRWLNAFLFNNGFHTIHHMAPMKHWSLAPEGHAKLVAPKIDPRLNEQSFYWFMFRVYLLSLIFPRFRTVPMRPASMRSLPTGARTI